MWTEQEIKLKETVHSTSFVIHKFVQLQLTVYSHSKIFSGRHRKTLAALTQISLIYNVSHKCHNLTRDENLQSCQGCTWGHWRAPSHEIVCTKLKVRKFQWLATRVCRSVISIQYRPQALQHTAADFHAKNSLVNVYMSSCRPFTCKFECIFKMTDFGCENTCKLLIFITTANMANEKLENNIVEKCLFAVKKKTTIHFLLLWMSCSLNQRRPFITFNGDLS